MGKRRTKGGKPDPFQKHYRRLNASDLQSKIGLAAVTAQRRRRYMRKIRRRNKPILGLAHKLYPSLRAYSLTRGRTNCVLGIDERIVRDVWDMCVQWARSAR